MQALPNKLKELLQLTHLVAMNRTRAKNWSNCCALIFAVDYRISARHRLVDHVSGAWSIVAGFKKAELYQCSSSVFSFM